MVKKPKDKMQDRPEPRLPSFAKDLLKETVPPPKKSEEREALEALAKLLGIEVALPPSAGYEGREKNANELKWAIESRVYKLQGDAKELKKIYDAFDTLARLQPFPPFSPFGRPF